MPLNLAAHSVVTPLWRAINSRDVIARTAHHTQTGTCFSKGPPWGSAIPAPCFGTMLKPPLEYMEPFLVSMKPNLSLPSLGFSF